MKTRILAILLAAAMMATSSSAAFAEMVTHNAEDDISYSSIGNTAINDLKVNALENPLGIDNATPEFSWTMESNLIGQAQSAYRIHVSRDDAFTDLAWDSGNVISNASVGILYDGQPLTPETDYYWRITVTDIFGEQITSDTAFFSTGLMNATDRSVWEGAQFIGSSGIVLGAPFKMNFSAVTDFQIIEGDNFSFIFGADDFRFTDEALNPFNSPGGENFIRFEIDTSEITETNNPGAKFAIYRVGYDETDDMNGNPNVYPYKWGRLPTSGNGAITYANKHDVHQISVAVSYSAVTIKVDGANIPTSTFSGQIATNKAAIGRVITSDGRTQKMRPGATNANVSPNFTVPESDTGNFGANTGGNANTYPNLNSIGFQVNNEGDKVKIDSLQINEVNGTNRIVFSNTVGATPAIFEGMPGVTVAQDGAVTVTGTDENAGQPLYADPSYGSMTYLRTEFATDKEVADAKLYATAMGGYEMFINGSRVGEDWFNPGLTQYREYLNYSTYDVTNLVNSNSDNAMSAVVGVGFWLGYMANTSYNTWGDDAGLMAKLVITYTDGSKKVVTTNTDDWQVCTDGPVTFSDLYEGEGYDANKEENIEGWKEIGFADINSKWTSPEVIKSKHPTSGDYTFENLKIIAKRDQPVRLAQTLTATRRLQTHTDTTYTYDMGTTMTGVPSVSIPAGNLKEGDLVVFRFGEFIYPGNEDTIDFDGNVLEYHRTIYGVQDYLYSDLYGPNGGYHKNAAGKPLHDTYRGALASDLYIASKADETRDVVIEPHFTFRSYRFIQISIPNLAAPLPAENVKGLELSSIQLPTGTYKATTGDDNKTAALTEQFFANTQQSQLGNFFSIPTDCPQRNERQGWTGDLQAYSRTATYHSLETQNFLRQWMMSVISDQGTNGGVGTTSPAYSFNKPNGSDSSIVWGGAIVQAPWQLYQQYNDLQVVKENYAAMKLYMASKAAPEAYPGLTTVNNLSDHIGLDKYTASGNGSNLLQNALWIYLTGAVAQMAEEMGDFGYAQQLRDRFELAVDSFNRAFFEPSTGLTVSRNISNGNLTNITEQGITNYYLDSQSTYAYPLFFDIVSDTMTITEGPDAGMSYKEFAAKRLAELVADPSKTGQGRGPTPNSTFALSGGPYTSSANPYTITTGFAATPSLLPAMTRNGNNETAYRLFTNTDYAAWLYPVNMGATSMWELWDSYERALGWAGSSAMNSFNHFALGAAGAWMYEYQIGITTGEQAGYQNFILQPAPGGNYTALEGSYLSNYGRITSSWTASGNGAVNANGDTVQTNDLLSYQCIIPANTTATLYLPVDATDFENIAGVTLLGIEAHNGVESAKFSLVSGGYTFELAEGRLVASLQEGYLDNGINFNLSLSTDAFNVQQDGYANITTEFIEPVNSNTAVLNYTFDTELFEFADFHPADGVTVIAQESTDNGAKVIVMIGNYETHVYGRLAIHAKVDAKLSNSWETVRVNAEYVVKDASGEKVIQYSYASTAFTTLGDGTEKPVVDGDTNGDGIVNLIDLSNMVDWMGIDKHHRDWNSKYTFFDFNNNGEIDIYDVAYVARLIA